MPGALSLSGLPLGGCGASLAPRMVQSISCTRAGRGINASGDPRKRSFARVDERGSRAFPTKAPIRTARSRPLSGGVGFGTGRNDTVLRLRDVELMRRQGFGTGRNDTVLRRARSASAESTCFGTGRNDTVLRQELVVAVSCIGFGTDRNDTALRLEVGIGRNDTVLRHSAMNGIYNYRFGAGRFDTVPRPAAVRHRNGLSFGTRPV